MVWYLNIESQPVADRLDLLIKCGQDYGIMSGRIERGRAAAAHRFHNPKVVGSSPTPAIYSDAKRLF